MRIATASLLALLLSGSGFAWAQTTGTTPPANTGTAPPASTGTMTRPMTAPSTARSTAASPAVTSSTSSMPAGGYATEAEAKGHCPSDTVVWANTSSKAYHMSGTKYYGKTKKGAYMCQKDADQAGFHAVKTGAVQAKKKTSS